MPEIAEQEVPEHLRMRELETVADIIDVLGGQAEVARYLSSSEKKVGPSVVGNWKTNGADGAGMIPAQYHEELVEMAIQIGCSDRVSHDVIDRICGRKRAA